MTTRRDFLKYAFMSGAAAGTATVLPQSIQRAFAIAPAPGTSWKDAEHVVILMQENRSFDHVFGTLQGVRGFNDPRPIRLPDGNPVFAQTGRSGETYLPWRLNIRDTRVTWMGSIPHSRDSQVDAWNDGAHDQWIDAKRSYHKAYGHYPLTMGYYTREDLPFYYALADAFTVCDQNYCGVMTSTTPNRLVFMTGTVRDRQDPTSNVYMRNGEILDGGMTWTTFPERLETVGVSWKYYQNDLSQTGTMTDEERDWLGNFGTNVLECFDQYCISANEGFSDWIDARVHDCMTHIERLHSREMLLSEQRDEQLAEARALLDVLKKRQASAGRTVEQLTPKERALFTKAFVTNARDSDYRTLETVTVGSGDETSEINAPKGDILHQFRSDVRDGSLPTVSWLSPPGHFSDHPTSPWYGAWYVSEVMDILTENPDVWRKTIFIITYDENDGYFDHCCSYAAADPHRPETGGSSASIGGDGLEYTTAQDEIDRGVPAHLARTGPIGLGFRVPMIIASPWSRGGWVNSQLFEHSSTLRFLEQFVKEKFGKDIRETNISPWRRAISGDLTSCFRTYDGSIPTLPYIDRNAYLGMIDRARTQPLPGGFRAIGSEEAAQLRSDPARLKQSVRQERGSRPSCAIPYEPFCDTRFDAGLGRLALALRAGTTLYGTRSAGVPFNIYRHGVDTPSGMQAGTYAVAAGDGLDVDVDMAAFRGDVYDVSIHAPNGFYRRYSGRKDGATLRTEARYLQGRGRHLVLTIRNDGASPRTLSCLQGQEGTPRLLRIAPGRTASVAFDLEASAMWYDIVLTEAADPAFRYEYGGRVETKAPGRTDPALELL